MQSTVAARRIQLQILENDIENWHQFYVTKALFDLSKWK